jgi:cell division protein FtsQ
MPPVKSTRRTKPVKNPRRRTLPRSAKTALRLGLPITLIAAIAATSAWLVMSGEAARIAKNAETGALALSAKAGLKVDNVLMTGRNRVSRAAIERALGARRGMAIMDFDPHAAKTRMERLTWVHSAVIERRLPDTIFIRIIERTPLALWQFRGRIALIDNEGVVITRSRLSRYRALPLVVGADAPKQARDLIEILALYPRLNASLHAHIRVSARRWNLKFKSGVVARLPEKGTARAVATLARLLRRERLLERDVVMIDLRFADRLVVRTTAKSEPKGKKTNHRRPSPGAERSKDT